MKVKIYANYGMLAHEHEPFFAVCKKTDACEEYIVEIPDEIAHAIDDNGYPVVELGGWYYSLCECLGSFKNKPCLVYDTLPASNVRGSIRRIMLKVVDIIV